MTVRRTTIGTLGERGFTLVEALIVVTLLAVGAAIAIPKFMTYMKRPEKTEPMVQLEKVRTATRRIYAETSAFPIGTATTLPAAGCCGYPNNKCPVVPKASWAQDTVWTALGFSIAEATLFQYAYTGDAEKFTATATGDLDCDGVKVMYKLVGTGTAEGPRIELELPKNAD